ncbi:MAG TPA: hypothetical protein VH720_01475 [Candidatus Limnocylindrales bacterium]|jgi:hypothetical protein
MSGLDILVLFLLAVAILDKLIDLDHECWRPGCHECEATRSQQREAGRPDWQ